MRRISLGPVGPNFPSIQQALREIEKASADVDIVDIAQAYTVTGTYTPTRSLNVTTPTTANIAAVLATLLDDLRRGGTNRST